VVDATPEKLACRAYLPDGQILDEFVIEKGAPQPNLMLSPMKAGDPWRKP